MLSIVIEFYLVQQLFFNQFISTDMSDEINIPPVARDPCSVKTMLPLLNDKLFKNDGSS